MRPLRLKEVIMSVTWNRVKESLIRAYPKERDNLSSYAKLFSDLKEMEPVRGDIEIKIEEVDEIVTVYGMEPGGQSVSIEYTPWNEWLGFPISKDTANSYTRTGIVIHSLFEMTWNGFDESQIQQDLEELKNTVKKIKAMTPEEKKAAFVTIDTDSWGGVDKDGESS